MSTTSTKTPAATTNGTLPEPSQLTISEKFVSKVEKQFVAEMGEPLSWTPLQRALAQHLYVKVDNALVALELKRSKASSKKNDPPITWENVNMNKLAMDAVSRVTLELDAAIPNHIHVIPYLSSATGKYDIDLRIGYAGVDHCRRKFAVDPPLEIRYQLVHETDKFSHGVRNGIAYVEFEQSQPFSPGEVIGGFGYVSYDDPRKNRVIIVEYREFEKAMKASKGVEFWGGEQTTWENNKRVAAGFDEKFRKEMQYKTVVHRVCAKIALDSAKVNSANLAALSDAQIDDYADEMDQEVAQFANVEVLELPVGSGPQAPPKSQEVRQESPAPNAEKGLPF